MKLKLNKIKETFNKKKRKIQKLTVKDDDSDLDIHNIKCNSKELDQLVENMINCFEANPINYELKETHQFYYDFTRIILGSWFI